LSGLFDFKHVISAPKSSPDINNKNIYRTLRVINILL